MAGCKCPGSCACKIKKPRKPVVRKAVLGGRVKQPQVVIQGMPAVSTTAIPQGYPYLTVTSDAAAKRSMTTQTETQAQPEIKKEVKEEPTPLRGGVDAPIGSVPLRELKGESLSLFLPTQTPSQQLSLLKSKITAGTTKKFPVLRATTGTQAGPSTATTGTQAGPIQTTTEVQTEGPTRTTTGTQFSPTQTTTGTQFSPTQTTTEVQTETPTRMTTEAQTNLIEHVGVGTQFGPSLTSTMTQTSMKVRSPEEIAAIAKEQKEAGIAEGYRMGRAREAVIRTKETREMATETEPLLVNVAKGGKQDIFNLMKEQEVTGKIVSLTGAGRPTRPFNESLGLAYPSPPAAPIESVPAPVPVGRIPRQEVTRTLPSAPPDALYKLIYPARIQYAV